MMPNRLPVVLILAFWATRLTAQDVVQSTADAEVDRDEQARRLEFFEQRIRPVLIASCYECHSYTEGEVNGGLELDHAAGWQAGGDSGTAIEPGDPDASLLIEAIRYEGLEMPPDGRLAANVVADFEKWISDGAADPRGLDVEGTPAHSEHAPITIPWSLSATQAIATPPVENSEWTQNAIDGFVLAELESRDMEVNPLADRYVLIRRLSYDLTGLPPSLEMIDAFLNDERPDAIERVVDRLIASPQFGEHWGRHWLDVARYADSNGSDFNATLHNAWRYRNYVIDSFNGDRRFDRFVMEQVAGDLLPHSTDAERSDNLVATGFLMLGPKMLSERDKEKLRMDVIDEQLDTVGRAFMGLTIGCARCHDHKFDPITTADYYALAGVFRSTLVLEGEIQKYVSNWHRESLPMAPADQRRLEEYEQAVSQAEQARDAARQQADQARQTWSDAQSELGLIVDDSDAEAVGEWKLSTHTPRFIGAGYRHDNMEGKGERELIYRLEIPTSGWYEVQVAYTGSSGRDTRVPYLVEHADGSNEVHVDQSQPPDIGRLFQPLGRFRFDAQQTAVVTLQSHATTKYVIADAVRFVPVDAPVTVNAAADAAADAVDQTGTSEETETDRLSDEGQRSIESAQPEWLEALDRFQTTQQQLAQAEKRFTDSQGASDVKRPVALAAVDRDEIVDCEIRIRGEHTSLGDVQPRNVPAAMQFDDGIEFGGTTSGRLELGRWLIDPEHPLTSRVIVNRVWSKLLGRGIVSSVDNFGNLGASPTHRELLDTLAIEFVENAWSIKFLVREIVLSSAYQMSSSRSAEKLAIDPDNQWLSRFQRRRLTAESIRDGILAMSENLDRSRGISPVEGYDTLVVDNNKQDVSVNNDASLLRTIYLPVIRNEIPPILLVFDFADPDVVVGRRPTTTVPAQALLILNSPFVRVAAEQIATSLPDQPTATIEHRLEVLYLTLFSRPPEDVERESVMRFLSAELGRDIDGETIGSMIDAPDMLRAWTDLIVALMASSEFRMLD